MNCQKLQQMALIKTAKKPPSWKLLCVPLLFLIYSRNLLACPWKYPIPLLKMKRCGDDVIFCESSICASFLLLVIYYTQWVFSFCAQSFVSATIRIVISKYVSQNSICLWATSILSQRLSFTNEMKKMYKLILPY